MFIQTETTPNPNVIKFLPGQAVSPQKNYDFKTPEDAQISPLATNIYTLEGIVGVFLGNDFISVSKDPSVEWLSVKPQVLSAIMDHYTNGAPIINEGADTSEAGNAEQQDEAPLSEEDALIVKTIKELLDLRIRPAVAQDGGDIIFHRYEDGIVYLEMHGACSGCPSASITLKSGIENMLKHYIPEVQEVRAAA